MWENNWEIDGLNEEIRKCKKCAKKEQSSGGNNNNSITLNQIEQPIKD